jgi:hypothetical protein
VGATLPRISGSDLIWDLVLGIRGNIDPKREGEDLRKRREIGRGSGSDPRIRISERSEVGGSPQLP